MLRPALAAVLLFLAAIISAFGYLRLEEMDREQEAVKRDVEYAQQRVRLRFAGAVGRDMAALGGVTAQMQRAQIEVVKQINRQRFEALQDPEINSRIAAYELAFRMQSAAPELIDLSRERPHTHLAYGTSRAGEAGSFSQNCLLARRLVERGVRFVSIFHRRWDHHSKLRSGLEENCRVVDQPIGALIQDLKQRGLLDSTVVVWGTEFGRTPVTQNNQPGPEAGRDHHRFGFSLWLAGGRVRPGQVIGKTDEFGWHAIEDRVHVHDFQATLLHLFGLDHLKLTYNFRGLEARLTNQDGKVVAKVMG